MSRTKNHHKAVKFRISTNGVVEHQLENLVAIGLYGESVPEVAEELIRLQIRHFQETGHLEKQSPKK
jgi:hypothetical protein